MNSWLSLHACVQVDSFNRALQRNTAAGKLTALFKTKMLSRSSLGTASPASSAKSPAASSGGGQNLAVSADELLQWSNVSVEQSLFS